MTDAPPPRYRIVERGRRLEVTDTWADTSPVQPTGPTREPRSEGRPSQFSVSEGDKVFVTIARLACRNRTNAAGQPILSTTATFDDKAPRSFVLGEQGQRRLAVSALAAAFALLAIAGMFSDTLLLALAMPAIAVAGLVFKGRPLITWWLDGFARLEGR